MLNIAFVYSTMARDTITLKICHEANQYPPYIFTENGKAQGLLVDIIKKAAIATETPIELYSNSWLRCKQDVKAGRAHALFAMVSTPKRQKEFAFPAKLHSDSWYMWLAQYPIFVPKGNTINLDNYQPINGIGAPLGYVVYDMLKQKEWISRFQYEPAEGLQMLSIQKLDGYVMERLIGLNLIKVHNLTSYVSLSDAVILTTPWYLAFNKAFYQHNSETVDRFWRAMASARQQIEKEVAVIN